MASAKKTAPKKKASPSKAKTEAAAKAQPQAKKAEDFGSSEFAFTGPNQTMSQAENFMNNFQDMMGMETFMNNSSFQFDKIMQDAANTSQAQMDAAMKSSTTLFKGMEDIMKTCMDIMQSSSEKSAGAMKTMMACKTLHEYSEAQSKLAQQSFDDFMSGATKLSEMSVKVCTDAVVPINDQMAKTMKMAS